MTSIANSSLPIRWALLIDAVASGGMGVLLLAAANQLAPLLGLPVSLLRGVGVFLIPFAAFLLWIARRAGALHGLIRTVVIGNVLWILGSILLLVSGSVSPTGLGTLFVVAQAAAVAVFAWLEYRAVANTSSNALSAST